MVLRYSPLGLQLGGGGIWGGASSTVGGPNASVHSRLLASENGRWFVDPGPGLLVGATSSNPSTRRVREGHLWAQWGSSHTQAMQHHLNNLNSMERSLEFGACGSYRLDSRRVGARGKRAGFTTLFIHSARHSPFSKYTLGPTGTETHVSEPNLWPFWTIWTPCRYQNRWKGQKRIGICYR